MRIIHSMPSMKPNLLCCFVLSCTLLQAGEKPNIVLVLSDDLRQRHQAGTLGEPFDTLFFRPQRPMFELFDLRTDPYELNDLAGKREVAKTERELKERLAEWMILERDFLPLPTEP
jgi:hypothetical protein